MAKRPARASRFFLAPRRVHARAEAPEREGERERKNAGAEVTRVRAKRSERAGSSPNETGELIKRREFKGRRERSGEAKIASEETD